MQSGRNRGLSTLRILLLPWGYYIWYTGGVNWDLEGSKPDLEYHQFHAAQLRLPSQKSRSCTNRSRLTVAFRDFTRPHPLLDCHAQGPRMIPTNKGYTLFHRSLSNFLAPKRRTTTASHEYKTILNILGSRFTTCVPLWGSMRSKSARY